MSTSDFSSRILGVDLKNTRLAGLCIGPTGSGKSVMGMQVANDVLKEGSKVLFITTERSPDQVLARMKGFGWDYANLLGDRLIFCDMYSWQIDGGQSLKETVNGYRLCPLNMTDLSLCVDNVREHLDQGQVIFDSLTNLVMLVGEGHALKLMQTLNARGREVGNSMIVLTSGVHSSSFEVGMKTVSDLVVELRVDAADKVKRYFRVSKFTESKPNENWIQFEITSTGLKFVGSVP